MNAPPLGFAFGPRLAPLDAARAEALRDAHGGGALTYAERGASSAALPDGYFHVDREWRLGAGDDCFDAARRAVLAWRVFPRPSWFRVTPEPADRVVGDALLFDVRAAGLWWGSLVRVLDVVDRSDRVAITVGTLAHHHARGEERFSVERAPGGDVVYRLRSFSVWNRAWTRAFSQVARRLQRRFAEQSVESVRAAVEGRTR